MAWGGGFIAFISTECYIFKKARPLPVLHGSCLAPWLAGDEALSLVKLYCVRSELPDDTTCMQHAP